MSSSPGGRQGRKVDWLPNVAIVGGYANQTGADYIQPNIGYVGVMGSYTFVDWGKRRNTIHGRRTWCRSRI